MSAPARIGAGERDRALCYERKTHHVVGHAGLSFLLRKLMLEKRRRQRNSKRRNHTAGHNRGHHGSVRIAAGCKDADRKCISRFIEGSAHVDRHHSAQNKTENDRVAGTQIVQNINQAEIDPAEERIKQVEHDRSGDKKADNRIQQNRL